MEKIFVVNVKYGKIAINPDGIKALLTNKNKKEEKVETSKVKTK